MSGNKNYKKGAHKEWRIANNYKTKGAAEGWEIAQRTAGSHSPIDIIAINPKTKEIHLIQAKPKSLSDNKKQEIEEKNKNLNGNFKVSFFVI